MKAGSETWDKKTKEEKRALDADLVKAISDFDPVVAERNEELRPKKKRKGIEIKSRYTL